MLSRRQESGRNALAAIQDKMPAEVGAVDLRFVECDFGDLKSVKRVADQLAVEEPRLDIVRALCVFERLSYSSIIAVGQ